MYGDRWQGGDGPGVRLIRDSVVIHEGKLKTLKRFKDEVPEVSAGQECGMAFENYEDIRKGDVIECFRVEEVARKLERAPSPGVSSRRFFDEPSLSTAIAGW